jgi:hypothetical protein
MALKAQSGTQFLRTQMILYVALFMGMVIANSIATLFVIYEPAEPSVDRNILYVVTGVLLVYALISSLILSRKKLAEAARKDTIEEKLNAFTTIFIIRAASIEAAVMTAAVSIYLTQDLTFLVVAGVSLVLFLMQVPSKKNIFQELQFSKDEQNQFNDPDQIVATRVVEEN